MPQRLMRSTTDRMIAGVCGGIGDHIGWPANRVRALYVLISIFSAAFPGLIVYLVLWAVLPERSTTA